jgi:hypothetical protein
LALSRIAIPPGSSFGRQASAHWARSLSDQEIEQNRAVLKTILAGRGITLP